MNARLGSAKAFRWKSSEVGGEMMMCEEGSRCGEFAAGVRPPHAAAMDLLAINGNAQSDTRQQRRLFAEHESMLTK
jgi:hypothetical protein